MHTLKKHSSVQTHRQSATQPCPKGMCIYGPNKMQVGLWIYNLCSGKFIKQKTKKWPWARRSRSQWRHFRTQHSALS